MKEFVLTQPYANVEEMINSAEVAIYKEELQQGDIEKYAIVSRIGNRYDLSGNKIEDFINNPFYTEIKEEPLSGGKDMKYFEIETLIDVEVANAVAALKSKHEKEIEVLKETHEKEIAVAKEQARAELIAKLNS